MSHTPDLEVLIVGAGFGGLGAAIELKKRGVTSFAVLEKAADLGGTWLVNRYPGCACDVESHLYSFSFAPNPSWSRSYSGSEEIWRYLKNCAEQYELGPYLKFNTCVQSVRWRADQKLWEVAVDNAPPMTARNVILATGALSHPKLPDIEGLDTFGGRLFHSQSWDHDYALEGKSVAVIGSGASAIQFVPHVAARAAQLSIFQRTAPWILPKSDRRFSGFEHKLFRRIPWVQRLQRGVIYSTNELRAIAFLYQPALLKMFEWLARRHIRRGIESKTLRETVTPDYRIGCKRVLISNDYYPALNRDNVTVVPQSVRALDATGVISMDGTHTPCDAVVLGTGFEVASPFDAGFVTGQDERDLAHEWEAGPEAYLGTVVAGFPNLFLIAGPNTALGHNSMIYMIESQLAFILSALQLQASTPDQTLAVDENVQRAFNDQVQNDLSGAVWSTGGCTSWYKHKNGKNIALWPGFTWQYRARTKRADPAVFSSTNRNPN